MAAGSAILDPTTLVGLGGQGTGGAPTGVSGAVTGGFGQGTPAAPSPNLSQMGTSPGGYYTDPNATPANTASTGGFFQSPFGQLLGAAVPVATGLYGAQQQNQNVQNLTNQLRAQVTPVAQYGQGVLGQLQGGAPVAGPAGQIIGGQLQGAQALTQAAQPYASGNLTQAQQLQLQQAAQGASANTNLAYAMSGNPLSSANIAAQQGIADQSIIAAGQIRQQNIQFAQQALQSAQQTYNGLLQQSLSSAELGLAGFAPAVAQQIKADQAIGSQMGNLFNQIAQGLTGRMASEPSAGGSAGAQFGSIVQKMLSGNTGGAVNQAPAQSVNSGAGFAPWQGPQGSDYAYGVSAPDVTPTGGFNDTSTVASDLSSGSPNWLGG
jgi:hypothetical protein